MTSDSQHSQTSLKQCIRCLLLSIQRLHNLGGEIAESAQKCTHLVANKVTRTVKFLTAMSIVKHIVTPEWLEESWKSQKFVGTLNMHSVIRE